MVAQDKAKSKQFIFILFSLAILQIKPTLRSTARSQNTAKDFPSWGTATPIEPGYKNNQIKLMNNLFRWIPSWTLLSTARRGTPAILAKSSISIANTQPAIFALDQV